MLNEPSILASGKSAPPPLEQPAPAIKNDHLEQLTAAVAEVMSIDAVDHTPPPPFSAGYTGQLLMESETAYAQLDEHFAALDYYAILKPAEEEENHRHVIMALKGRANLTPRPVWPNVVLLCLTVLSLLYVGAAQATGGTDLALWRGWPYAVSVLLILGAHELGHYFAARHHKINVTLPYFFPLPFGFFGTLGAFIQLREPMRNRKVLFDVGAAGPLAGLIVTLPILLIGLITADVIPLPEETYIMEGNSLLYAATKFMVFGKFLPGGGQDVLINQMTKAGWMGLLITGLNLIPLGQLDGGHIIFTLIGKRARYLYMPVMALFVLLSFYNSVWMFWVFILFFVGRVHAVPLDMVTPLDQRRRRIGYAVLVIFILVFVPNPLEVIQP